MAERKEFFCHQAASRGFPTITKEYCLEKCDSAQKGVKAECPESVRLSLKDIKLLEDIRDAKELGKRLKIKPGHRTHKAAKERWGRRRTRL